MKKFPLILFLLLIVGCFMALPALANPIYPDVKIGHWAEKDIAKMKAKGIVAGFADGYHPSEAVSREQAIVMLIRTMGKAQEAYGKKLPANFKNSQLVSSWARESVALAVELGLLGEEDLSNFRPKDSVKRSEIAVFVAKSLGYKGNGGTTQLGLRDEKEIPLKAKGYVQAVLAAGIMSGFNDNTFRPNDPLSRAQMASLLRTLDQKLNRLTDKTVYGRVFAISVNDNSVLLERDSGQIETISLAKDCYIYKGERSSLADLAQGDRVEIILNNKGEAAYVEVFTGKEVTEKKVTGVITLITRTPAITLRLLTADGKSNDYTLADKAIVFVDGIEAQPDQLRVGQNVTLTISANEVTRVEVSTKQAGENLKEDTETEEEKEAVLTQSYLSGEIVELDSLQRAITIRTEKEKVITKILLDLPTVLLKGTQPITFANLAKGEQVVAVGSWQRENFVATSIIVLERLE